MRSCFLLPLASGLTDRLQCQLPSLRLELETEVERRRFLEIHPDENVEKRRKRKSDRIDAHKGLILVNQIPGSTQTRLSPLVLLQAYHAVLARNPNRADLSTRYELLLNGLAKSHPHNLTVLRALAKRELSKRSPEGNAAAESYLSKAVDLKSNSPQDYMLLSELLYRGGRKQEAVTILERAIGLFPYVPTPYQNLSVCYISMGDAAKAREVLKNGLQVFPGDANLRAIQRRLEASR